MWKSLVILVLFLKPVDLFSSDKDISKILDQTFTYVFPSKSHTIYLGVNPTIKDSQDIAIGALIGEIRDPYEGLPEIAVNHILAAEKLYDSGEYTQAILVLDSLIHSTKRYPILLNELARTYYRADKRDKAYSVYIEIMDSLEQMSKQFRPSDLVLFPAYRESYWKIGTLHLDRGEYELAITRIAESLLSLPPQERSVFLQQTLDYLCEAYFYLKDFSKSRYYGEATLHIFPDDTYVLEYLSKSKK